MLHYKIGNLLDAPQKVIAHQVNCQGVMGSGVAKAIRDKYPVVYDEYRKYYQQHKDHYEFERGWSAFLEGAAQWVEVSNERVVANLFGQKNYGYDGKRYTSYGFLADAIRHLCGIVKARKINEFAIPYKMGCDRGGADWNVVESILEDYSNLYGIDIYIYSLEGY